MPATVIMLPLAGHRRLFAEYGPDGDAPAEERSSSIFLRPFAREDAEHLAGFTQTDSWRMMQILHASFRQLAPPDLDYAVESIPPSPDPGPKGQMPMRTPEIVGGEMMRNAAAMRAIEIGAVAEDARYRLMRNSHDGSSFTDGHD